MIESCTNNSALRITRQGLTISIMVRSSPLTILSSGRILLCCSVVSKRYIDWRDGTHTGRAHNLLLQKLREGPLETGQPFRAHRTPKGCDRFLSLSAGPVRLSFLTGRYDRYSSSPGTGGPVCRQAARLRDRPARGVSPRSLCAMPATLDSLSSA